MKLTKDHLIEGIIVKKGTEIALEESSSLKSVMSDILLDYEDQAKELRNDIKQAYELIARLNPIKKLDANAVDYFKSDRTDKFIRHMWRKEASGNMSYNDVFSLAYEIIKNK